MFLLLLERRGEVPPVDSAPVTVTPQLRIAPSILSADFAALADAIDLVEPETDLLHVDVMDGHFVPNLTIGPPVVADISRHTDMTLDCHLMMTNPGEYLEAFRRAGADWISVHVEVGDTAELIDRDARLGVDPGLALNPETPFDAVAPWLGAHRPGARDDRAPRVRRAALHARGRAQAPPGGRGGRPPAGTPSSSRSTAASTPDTIGLVADAGATCFVAGNAVFGGGDPAGAVRHLRERAARPEEPR